MTPLRRVKKKSLSDEVFDQLSEEIVHGELEPGSDLPSERVLCEELGVNRGAVREALKRLAQAGLVSIRQGGLTRVLNFRNSAGLDLMTRILMRPDGTLDLEVARSVLEMRSSMGPEIARACAERGSAEIADELAALVAEMAEAAEDLDRLQLLGIAFWEVLARGSGNIAYQLSYNTLRHTYERIREALVNVMATELRDLERHRALAAAVAEHAPEDAARIARELLREGASRILRVLAALERSSQSRDTRS